MLRRLLCILLSAMMLGVCSCAPPSDEARASLASHDVDTATPPPPTPTPAPTPSPTPEPTPSPTPVPTPTPDPDDIYFLDGAGEEVFVNEDRTRFEYRSKTLSVMIDERFDEDSKTRYYVAHIRTRGEMPQAGYGNGSEPSTKRKKPYLIARQYGAVFAQNADFFIEPDNPKGVVIRGGKVYDDDKRQDTLAILPDGDLAVYHRGEIDAQTLLDMGVTDTFSFGPILVTNHEHDENVNKSRVGGHNPRSGIGMVKSGHFVSIVVDGYSKGMSRGVKLETFADMFIAEGCEFAYNMDGGQSSSMIFMGDSCNTQAMNEEANVWGQRSVPDILWFGFSENVPGEKDAVINDGQGGLKPWVKLETREYSAP